MKKLSPILLEDIAEYRIPSGLKYSPSGEYLAFHVKSADMKKNNYHTNVWLSRQGKPFQATWSLDATVIDWLDDEHLILSRHTQDTPEGLTELFLLNVHGGEAYPWITLPFVLASFKKLTGTLFAVTGSIDTKDPDAYLDDEEKRKEKSEARKEDMDYQVVDEVPYWFNGQGYVNGQRTALFTVALENDSSSPVCRRITAPDFDVEGITVSGQTIYYWGNTVKGKRPIYNKVFAFNTSSIGVSSDNTSSGVISSSEASSGVVSSCEVSSGIVSSSEVSSGIVSSSEASSCDASSIKAHCLYSREDMNFSGLFVMDGKLYGHASDMKIYGCNQTANLYRIEEDRLILCYVPEVSLYSSVIGDTAEGGASHKVSGSEFLTLATIEAHNAIFSFSSDEKGTFVKKTIWEQEGMLCQMDVSADRIAVVYQDWNHVAEVYEMKRDGTEMAKLTCLNDKLLEGRYIAKPHRIDYTSEGENLRGWVLFPQALADEIATGTLADSPASDNASVASPDSAPDSTSVISPDSAPDSTSVISPDSAPDSTSVISQDSVPDSTSVISPDSAPCSTTVISQDSAAIKSTVIDVSVLTANPSLRQYPAILDIHGGPRCAYGETFFHEMQFWTARGYIVFFTNIRGSDGRGDAFADIRDAYGYVDYRNLCDFTDAVLKAYPIIDPARLCVTGGSYGGFMTNWIIGHTDRFCCAASQRSISNWISFSFISDIGEIFGPDQCGAPGLFGDENTETLWKHSPLKYADQVNTPTLFIHSDEDYRCPLPEGMQMMQALADRGIETRMCIFKGENHELSRSGKPKHRIRRLREITEWFDRHTAAE